VKLAQDIVHQKLFSFYRVIPNIKGGHFLDTAGMLHVLIQGNPPYLMIHISSIKNETNNGN